MTSEERVWLRTVAPLLRDKFGWDPEEYDPRYMSEDWDAVRRGETWMDAEILTLVLAFDMGATPQQLDHSLSAAYPKGYFDQTEK